MSGYRGWGLLSKHEKEAIRQQRREEKAERLRARKEAKRAAQANTEDATP
jgi:hypothetical protein